MLDTRPIRPRSNANRVITPDQAAAEQDAHAPGVPIIGQADGGLERRLVLRSVMDRMKHAAFRFGGKTTDGRYIAPSKMNCAECIAAKLTNVRSFRTWDALRDHLISYHGIDRREVPE